MLSTLTTPDAEAYTLVLSMPSTGSSAPQQLKFCQSPRRRYFNPADKARRSDFANDQMAVTVPHFFFSVVQSPARISDVLGRADDKLCFIVLRLKSLWHSRKPPSEQQCAQLSAEITNQA